MNNLALKVEAVASKLGDFENTMSILSDYFDEASGEPSIIAINCFYGRAEAYHALVRTLWDALATQKETLSAISKEIETAKKENLS